MKIENNTYEYSYYLFTKGKESTPKVIGAKSLQLKEFAEKKYTNINKNEFMANSSTYLFNMLAHSNQELLEAVINRYNSLHPMSKLNAADYDYIAMLGPSTKTKKYSLMTYKFSTKMNPKTGQREVPSDREDKIKLVPFVFHDDILNLAHHCNKAGIELKPNDLNHPANLLVKVICAFRKLSNSQNDNYKSFYQRLEKKYENLVDLKYEDRYKYSSEEEKHKYAAVPAYDQIDIVSTLNSRFLSHVYKLDATLYFNIISMICHDIRINTIANDQGFSYEPINQKIGYDDISEYFKAKSAIRSVEELRKEIKLEHNNKADEYTIEISYEEIANQVLDKYNSEYGTNISFSDIEATPEDYEEIIYTIDAEYKMQNNISLNNDNKQRN